VQHGVAIDLIVLILCIGIVPKAPLYPVIDSSQQNYL
jgi:hypothetical protein